MTAVQRAGNLGFARAFEWYGIVNVYEMMPAQTTLRAGVGQ